VWQRLHQKNDDVARLIGADIDDLSPDYPAMPSALVLGIFFVIEPILIVTESFSLSRIFSARLRIERGQR
jgi:hypothetical protein